jgi:hypothetical protein
MEDKTQLIGAFAYSGMFVGLLLLLVGFRASARATEGKRSEWGALGLISIPAAWVMSFPLSNRDHPLTWFTMYMLMFGGGLGTSLLIAELIARRARNR